MRQMRKITRSARKLRRSPLYEADAPLEGMPVLRMEASGPASVLKGGGYTAMNDDDTQAVEDSLVEIFDNVIAFVVKELQVLDEANASEPEAPSKSYPPNPSGQTDRRKTLL